MIATQADIDAAIRNVTAKASSLRGLYKIFAALGRPLVLQAQAVITASSVDDALQSIIDKCEMAQVIVGSAQRFEPDSSKACREAANHLLEMATKSSCHLTWCCSRCS